MPNPELSPDAVTTIRDALLEEPPTLPARAVALVAGNPREVGVGVVLGAGTVIAALVVLLVARWLWRRQRGAAAA